MSKRSHRSQCDWARLLTACAILSLLTSHAEDALGDGQPLFDGKTLQGWTTLEGKPVTRGWEVVDGAIHLKPSNNPSEERVGHILSEREYGDFDLSFEWKIAPRGNSGLKYRVRDYGDYLRGCEYQILDDAMYDKRDIIRTSAGALYDLYEPNSSKHLNPPGEFNTARIVVHGNHIQHWLNGSLIVSAEVGSADWKHRVAQSKFSENPGFAENRLGKIMLTDHGGEVWYRNFDFRLLDKE